MLNKHKHYHQHSGRRSRSGELDLMRRIEMRATSKEESKQQLPRKDSTICRSKSQNIL